MLTETNSSKSVDIFVHHKLMKTVFNSTCDQPRKAHDISVHIHGHLGAKLTPTVSKCVARCTLAVFEESKNGTDGFAEKL